MKDDSTSGPTTGSPPSPSPSAPSPPPRSRLEHFKDLASLFQSAFTVIAFIVAAWWFLQQREALPRAVLTHTVAQRLLTPDWRWVRLSVHVSNLGRRALELKSGKIWLEKILPLEDKFIGQLARNEDLVSQGAYTVQWLRLGNSYAPKLNVVLEPGESQDIEFDFIVAARVRTITAYSYFERRSEPSFGWEQTTIHDLLPCSEAP